MDTWTAISGKRAIRSFADRPLEPAHVERILRAGRHAGSSKNQQRWDFVVCRDREHLRQLSEVGPYAGHLAGQRWRSGSSHPILAGSMRPRRSCSISVRRPRT